MTIKIMRKSVSYKTTTERLILSSTIVTTAIFRKLCLEAITRIRFI